MPSKAHAVPRMWQTPTTFPKRRWPRFCSAWSRLACFIRSMGRTAVTRWLVIRAIDGPLFITSCVTVRGECDQSDHCNIREPLRRVSHGIEELLRGITILELKKEETAHPGDKARGDKTKTATEFVTIG